MVESYAINENNVSFILPRGGEYFPQVLTRVDDNALARLKQCARRWPYENTDLLTALNTSLAQDPNKTHWLVCDTAYFFHLPSAAAAYALPIELREQGFRKYGVNGIHHQWVAEQYPTTERIVSICLNEWPSVAAIGKHRPVDTTGGYSLLDGLPGRSTCGSIDPSIILLLEDEKQSTETIDEALNKDCGWQALVGFSFSLADLVKDPSDRGNLTRELLLHELLKATGTMLGSLGGAERIIIGCEGIDPTNKFVETLISRLAFMQIEVSVITTDRENAVKNLFLQMNGG